MSQNIPAHVAIIMDGNGRWAAKRLLPRSFGHKKGVDAVRRTVRKAAGAGIKILTLYAFSTENWRRPKEEVDSLMELFVRSIDDEVPDLRENSISLRFIGLRNGLPAHVLEKIDRAEKATSGGVRLRLNVALNYSSRSEITDAVKRLVSMGLDGEEIDEDTVSGALFTADCPDPDLLIRTGGEHRLSNFLLWQAAYSELYFTDVLWPDFSEKDLDKAIVEYGKRERRYGGLK